MKSANYYSEKNHQTNWQLSYRHPSVMKFSHQTNLCILESIN